MADALFRWLIQCVSATDWVLCVCVCVSRYEYMIDNVILLLKGTLNGRDVNELIGQVKETTQLCLQTAFFLYGVLNILVHLLALCY